MKCDMASDQETDTSYTMDTIFSDRFKRRTPQNAEVVSPSDDVTPGDGLYDQGCRGGGQSKSL